MRICVISDAIVKPLDEGVKIFVYNLIKEFSKKYKILCLSTSNHFEEDIASYCKKAIPNNKLFFSFQFRKEIRAFKPDVIYYIPIACATFSSFARARVLKHYSMSSKIIMITLQPRHYSFVQKKIIPFISPDRVLTQSFKTESVLNSLGCKAKTISAGVDIQKFTPVAIEKKSKLRKKYGLPKNKFVVLHVGHINRNRNVGILEAVQDMQNTQAIVVGSTSTPQDNELGEALRKKGVVVLTSYIENIEEIYQCADCYLFPVFSESACIEIPLSVFEAMACGLPVVTTKFGGLPNLINEQSGFVYVNTMEEILPRINLIKKVREPGTRRLAKQFSWESVAKQVICQSGIQY